MTTKVSELIEELKEILETEGDLEIYTAVDAEGNGYNQLHYAPTAMYREKGDDYRPGFMYNIDELHEDHQDDPEGWEGDYVKVCVL